MACISSSDGGCHPVVGFEPEDEVLMKDKNEKQRAA